MTQTAQWLMPVAIAMVAGSAAQRSETSSTGANDLRSAMASPDVSRAGNEGQNLEKRTGGGFVRGGEPAVRLRGQPAEEVSQARQRWMGGRKADLQAMTRLQPGGHLVAVVGNGSKEADSVRGRGDQRQVEEEAQAGRNQGWGCDPRAGRDAAEFNRSRREEAMDG